MNENENVRYSKVYVECHRACDKTGVSDYFYEISFDGNFIPEDRQLSATDLRDLRDAINAALKLTDREEGGEV